MQKYSLKALGAALLSLGLVVLGAALPANAVAGITLGTPTPSFYENSNTPAFSVTVDKGSAFVTGGGPVQLGVSTWNPLFACSSSPVAVPSNDCGVTSVSAVGGGTVSSPTVQKMAGNLKFDWTGTTSAVQITFAPGAWTTSSAGSKTMTAFANGTPLTLSITVNSGVAPPASSSVTFNANGGTGAMADQSASSASALSANAFTRSGFNFAGWNTAADGSGTAYADGANFPFTSNTTLYAQWTATLATTGFDGAPYLFGGLALAGAGGALMLIARRKQSN